MTREEYLAQLKKYLKKLPQADYEEAIDYFTEYFDEVGPEGEPAAMQELGSPKEAAHDVLSRLLEEKIASPDSRKRNIIWIAILACFAAPLALPMAFVCIGTIFSIILAAVAICFSIFLLGMSAVIVGLSFIWESLTVLSPISSSALGLGFGIGLFAIGVGLLVFLAAFYISKGGKWLILKIFRWISQRRKSA